MKNKREPKIFQNVKYHHLDSNRNENEHVQFVQYKKYDTDKQTPIPWKAVIFALLLCIGGIIHLLIGTMLFSGHIDTKYADRSWPVIILGALMFLPGSYHVFIAVCAYKGYLGYSFDDIPEFS